MEPSEGTRCLCLCKLRETVFLSLEQKRRKKRLEFGRFSPTPLFVLLPLGTQRLRSANGRRTAIPAKYFSSSSSGKFTCEMVPGNRGHSTLGYPPLHGGPHAWKYASDFFSELCSWSDCCRRGGSYACIHYYHNHTLPCTYINQHLHTHTHTSSLSLSLFSHTHLISLSLSLTLLQFACRCACVACSGAA